MKALSNWPTGSSESGFEPEDALLTTCPKAPLPVGWPRSPAAAAPADGAERGSRRTRGLRPSARAVPRYGPYPAAGSRSGPPRRERRDPQRFGLGLAKLQE